MAYNGSTVIGSGLVPRKNNDYPLIDAHHVQVGDTEAPEDRLDYILEHSGSGSGGGEAGEYALLSESWAIGGTGLRPDEDTNNAKYYAEQAAAGGGGDVPSSHVNRRDNPHQVTKAQVGLGNVDNTSDADKPLSDIARAAISGKAPLTHTHQASQITHGTFNGAVVANATAQEALGTAMVRNIYIGTTDLTAGTSALPTGTIYFVYEA